jgi:hypothetical protein
MYIPALGSRESPLSRLSTAGKAHTDVIKSSIKTLFNKSIFENTSRKLNVQ